MYKKLGLSLAAGGLFLGLLVSNANASLVPDGDFTSPSGGGMFTTYDSTSNNTMGPWTVTSGSVDLIGGYWNGPTAGTGSVDLDGDRPGSLSQGLSLGAGSYVLTFSLSGNPDNGVETNFLNVSVGNASQNFSYTVGNTNGHSNMNYLTESVAFTTTGATNLVFASLDANGAYGPVIGNVSVSAVPLPASLQAFLLGLVALAGFHYISRQRKLAA